MTRVLITGAAGRLPRLRLRRKRTVPPSHYWIKPQFVSTRRQAQEAELATYTSGATYEIDGDGTIRKGGAPVGKVTADSVEWEGGCRTKVTLVMFTTPYGVSVEVKEIPSPDWRAPRRAAA